MSINLYIHILTWRVEVIITISPGQFTRERGEDVIEGPGDDHVEVNANEVGYHWHGDPKPLGTNV